MIQFNQVKKSFRKTEVLKGLDLQINRGERIALVGSNGAGKTTMIRCLLGEYIHEGKVFIDGQEPRQKRQEVLKKIGFVPQLPPPLKMPVGQLVRYTATLCESDEEKIIDVIEKLGLDYDKIRTQPFVKLSGGQKQKVLISMALGRDAEILILDEPAANLDPEARHIFFSLLAEKQDNAVMLISSHRLDEIAPLVNRVIEMDQGLVVLDDKVEDEIDLDSLLTTEIRIRREDAAFAKAIDIWGFQSEDNIHWKGQVSGPDRLRFLGVLSRYAALLAAINMDEKEIATDQENQDGDEDSADKVDENVEENGEEKKLKLQSEIKWLLVTAFIIMLSACSEQNTGPADVKWDRDSCERCRMMLSDRQYSAQIRVFPEGKRSKVKKFDDIGCATLWLDASEWKDDQKTEIWVRSFKEDQWIDAKKAWYVTEKVTPMGYGLGAQTEKQDGALSFEEAKQHIIKVEKKFNIHGGNYSH